MRIGGLATGAERWKERCACRIVEAFYPASGLIGLCHMAAERGPDTNARLDASRQAHPSLCQLPCAPPIGGRTFVRVCKLDVQTGCANAEVMDEGDQCVLVRTDTLGREPVRAPHVEKRHRERLCGPPSGS